MHVHVFTLKIIFIYLNTSNKIFHHYINNLKRNNQ